MDELETRKAGGVSIFLAATEIDAEMVRLLLESEGIPVRIGEQVNWAQAPMLQLAGGYWGKVFVPASAAMRAREILDAYEEAQGRVSEEELAEAAERATDPGV